jgi:glycerol uptake facilitator-like aquaporin
MKKLLFVFGSFVLTSVSFAATVPSVSNEITSMRAFAKRDVPPPIVVASFQAIFGNVPVLQWKARSNGQWRAHFLRNGVHWEATFTSTGILVKSERA